MERLLHQVIQDYLMSTSSNCLLLVPVFALSVILLFYWQRILEYFRGMPSPIPSLMSLWSSRKRPRLTCVDEVNSHNQSTSCQMSSSLSPPSSSSHAPRIKYDVFISFRGLDTRRGFLSHLLEALNRAKIEVFVDYKLREGDELSPALFTAIEESRIALIIFSEDYASSKWCLEELVKITECMMENGQIVIPIFYKVDPSYVRHQEGCYKNAFAKHKKLFKGNITEKWKTTLNEVANLSGFHSKNFETEAKLIEEVVRRVLTRLSHKYQVNLKGLIGIDKSIADLEQLICCTRADVRVIGIWGMGGIGKTTIAGALFSMLSSEYEGRCFLANVRVELEKHGIIQLKSQLISILLEEKDLKIDIPNGVPDDILRRLRRKKVLVVLDDVDNSNTVTDLIGGHDWLGSGSRIIVTTRNKHVIHRDDRYEVKALGCDDALKLLNLHAFNNGNHLQMNSHELMMKVVEYAKGLPLALKILGASLRGKSDEEWESQLQKLQKMPYPEIQAVLRLSYEGLDREDKSIFLYIACFFNRDDMKYPVQALLDACGYKMPIALRNLQDKALIEEVSGYENVSLHDLIREMGREIVREQNIERPGERSHLWDPDDICRVLEHDEGTQRIQSITLDMSRVSDLRLNPQSFAGMTDLKLLRFYNSHSCGRHGGVHLPEEGLETLSKNLRLFHWDQYPSKSLPAIFIPDNLVELRMPRSRVEKLWDGAPNLAKLKVIDLSESELVELPDLSKASGLRLINLFVCRNLLSIHPSIFYLQRLEWVYLVRCERLQRLPDIEALPSSGRFCSTLNHLGLHGCKRLKHLPDSLSKLSALRWLDLGGCIQLDTTNLQNILDGLSSLQWLDLNHCHNLFELPENISKLSSLEHLFLEGTSIKSLPESIKHLPRLKDLHLSIIKLQEASVNT